MNESKIEPAPAKQANPVAASCGPTALWGWSPQALPADTAAKRLVDRILLRGGFRLLIFFAAVFALLQVGQALPRRADLAATGLAALAAGSWCALNFWRCRHAHCVVTATGWLALSAFCFVEVALGRSLIGGYEPPVFLGVLALGLLFEAGWRHARGTNAVLTDAKASGL
jgi:hypothetical protein